MDLPACRDLLDLTGRTAVVTGAGRGLGAAIAARLAEAGASVVVHYRSGRADAERVVAGIADAGGTAVAEPAELDGAEGAEALIAAAVGHFGTPAILVNNAGIYPTGELLDMSLADWAGMQRANVETALACTQAAARRMRDAGGGAIVNIASISAYSPAPAHAHYNASKAALVMLTRSAAQELGPSGIRVNAVSPGVVDRPGLREDWPDGVARWEARVPLGRLCAPADVADACLFLASDAARFVSGQDLVVDGGMLATSIF